MATTTNYSWTTPDNTAYVKDGASAIRSLGSSVDSTLFTALGGAYPGLRLIKKQTIGSAVTSVTVTSAFSATYDNYKIFVTGGVGSTSAQILRLQLGSITTGYYGNLIYAGLTTGTVQNFANNNALAFSNWVGTSNAYTTNANIDVTNPFLTEQKLVSAPFMDGAGSGFSTGICDGLTSVSQFTISVSTGTLTGGTIYVYGYGTS